MKWSFVPTHYFRHAQDVPHKGCDASDHMTLKIADV